MKLKDIYDICVRTGIEYDARDREEIDRVLAENKKAYDKLEADEREFFDTQKLSNPYSDTRICAGDPDQEIRGAIVGVDMEPGEVVLADRLRERGEPIDLIFAHHPEGPGLREPPRGHVSPGRSVGHARCIDRAADALIAPRAEEIHRRIMPVNHYRAIDAARLLGFASMSCHTPADNAVNSFVQASLDEAAPLTLSDIVKALRQIPEYRDAALKGYGPIVVQGSESGRAGRIVVDMTGGTEGPTEALNRLSDAGVGTLVGMHYSEEHRKRAEELKVNLVIAGHISSDVLGMNLILDAIQREGDLQVVPTSGMVRFSRL